MIRTLLTTAIAVTLWNVSQNFVATQVAIEIASATYFEIIKGEVIRATAATETITDFNAC